MKNALLGEMNPTMSSVIGTTTGYSAAYSETPDPDIISEKYSKAAVPDTAKEQWELASVPESRNVGSFYKGPRTVVEPSRRFPPPTRYDSYTPTPPKPEPPFDCSTRPNRSGESKIIPDPAWGYTGHEYAHRYDAGDEDLTMASRIAKRRKESIERRYNSSPDKKKLIAAATSNAEPGVRKPFKYGWAEFPPKGMYKDKDTDLQAGQTTGPNNGQISSAKLYASNGN